MSIHTYYTSILGRVDDLFRFTQLRSAVNMVGVVNFDQAVTLLNEKYGMNPINIDNNDDLAFCRAAQDLFDSIKPEDLDFGATAKKYGINTNSDKVNVTCHNTIVHSKHGLTIQLF